MLVAADLDYLADGHDGVCGDRIRSVYGMKQVRKVFVWLEPASAYDRGILYGISRYFRTHRAWEVRRTWGRRGHFSAQEIRKELDLDGILARETSKLHTAIRRGVPTILVPYDDTGIKEQMPHIPYIVSNSVKIGTMAAESLLDRGLRHFAFCGLSDKDWSNERKEAFCNRILQAGYETSVYARHSLRPRGSWSNEQTLMATWLKSLPKPVGLMVCTDIRARDVVETCKLAQLHIPEEVAVIGVDNDNLLCTLCQPPLSSISLNTEKAGYTAALLLDQLMNQEKEMKGQQIIVDPVNAVLRQSTDVVAIEDPDVANAVRFIRENSNALFQVSHVAEEVGLSRRALEKRFRAFLNRSIHEEIKRVRINAISEMLVGEDVSISEIALKMGFSGLNNFARYFKKAKGVSPNMFRKLYGSNAAGK